jgi:hypothetical protein
MHDQDRVESVITIDRNAQQNHRLTMQPRQHKTASFLSAHPVSRGLNSRRPSAIRRARPMLRAYPGITCGQVTSSGVSREVFAAVPAHLAAERMVIDRFAAASKLCPDGVLGFHSALELQGIGARPSIG